MNKNLKILRASGAASLVTLGLVAVCGSLVFPQLPWNGEDLLGAAILLRLVPGAFFTVEILHLMVLSLFVFTLPRVFILHGLVLGFAGWLLWCDQLGVAGTVLQGMRMLIGAAVIFPLGVAVYLREWGSAFATSKARSLNP